MALVFPPIGWIEGDTNDDNGLPVGRLNSVI